MTEGSLLGLLGLQRGRARGYSHQAFQPSGGGASSKPPFGAKPYRSEVLRYIGDSFVLMSAAHDLDRADKDVIALNGKY